MKEEFSDEIAYSGDVEDAVDITTVTRDLVIFRGLPRAALTERPHLGSNWGIPASAAKVLNAK
jgi:hypothetical protein